MNFEIQGQYNKAIYFAPNDYLDSNLYSQVLKIMNMKEYENSFVRIMSDGHVGSGCTIGTTMTISNCVTPNFVGVDLGCGLLGFKLNCKNLSKSDFIKLDETIQRSIPSGFRHHKDIDQGFAKRREKISSLFDTLKAKELKNFVKISNQLGTLGGGNHFIEIDKSENGEYWLLIHSGSRNIGLQIAQHYQKIAVSQCPNISKEHAFLDKNVNEETFNDYLHDMKICQEFASLSRQEMVMTICEKMKWTIVEQIESVHNYIDFKRMILRKGAISAEENEFCLIPLNMRDGTLICRGKGNPEWNYSAPHGAGRLYSRGEAKKTFSLKEYRESMTNVFTSCVSTETIDESPFAYKNYEEIMLTIEPTVDIIERVVPVYNFKAK